jgi:hypothetical protein
MADQFPSPAHQAACRRQAVAAITQRLRLIYEADASRAFPDRLRRLLDAMDRSEQEQQLRKKPD